MYRSYPNVLPVANRYLSHKTFLKDQEKHANSVKNARSVLNLTDSSEQFKFSPSVRQKQTREHALTIINQENERMRAKMTKTQSFLDNHNNYTVHSLNATRRQREQAKHQCELQRLKKQLNQIRTSYPAQGFRKDFEKSLVAKKRISRYPSNVK